MKNSKIQRSGLLLTLLAVGAIAAGFAVVLIDTTFEPNSTGNNSALVTNARGGFNLLEWKGSIVAARFANPDGSGTWALYAKVSMTGTNQWGQISETVEQPVGEDPPELTPNPDLVADPLVNNLDHDGDGELIFGQHRSSHKIEVLVPGVYGGDGPLIAGTVSVGDGDRFCGPGTDYICVYF